MSNIQVTPEKLRSLATTCSNQAGQVSTVRTTTASAIRNSGWKSPAASRFESDWNQHYAPALQKLEAALKELGGAANKMARNYDETEQSYRGVS